MLNEKELEEIRRKLLEAEEAPPVAAWKNIQKEIKPDKGHRRAWWLSLALLLLFTGLGVIIEQNKQGKENVTVAREKQTFKQETLNPPHQSENKNPTLAKPAPEPANKIAALNLPDSGVTSEKLTGSIAGVHQVVTAATAQDNIVVKGKKARPGDETKALNIGTNNPEPEKKRENQEPTETNEPALASVKDLNNSKADSNLASGNTLVVRQDSVVANKPDVIINVPKPDSASQLPTKDQPKVHKPRRPESWVVGVLFAPRYAFRKFTPNQQDDILITRMNRANKLNTERMGFEYGLSLSKAVNQRFYLDAGLSLMQLKENVAYSYTTGKLDSTTLQMTWAPDGSVTVNTSYKTEERQLISSYQYGGLRLGTTYYFRQNNQSRLNITAAAGANLLIKGRTKQYLNGTWIETIVFPSKENILEQSNYNLLLGLGYNTLLHKSYELMVMPTINYFLGSTFKEREPFGLRPYSLGISVQIRRGF